MWCHRLRNKVLFMTDNDSVVHVINTIICLRNTIMYTEHPICPVSLMLDYVTLWGSALGPFLAGLMGQLCLDLSLPSLSKKFCNIATLMKIDKMHSFRIGAASWAAAKGMSDFQIRVFGRWNSNVFLPYIRIPTLGT